MSQSPYSNERRPGPSTAPTSFAGSSTSFDNGYVPSSAAGGYSAPGSTYANYAYNSSRGSDHELSESNPPRRDRISPPLPPSLPPNPYTARTTSRAPPLPTPRPPSGARAATNTDRWRQPQYPCYLPASAPCTTDSGLDQASRNDPPHSFAQASHGNVAHDDDETAASLHPRDSIASGIISMYGGDPAGSRNPNAPAYPSASANATTSQYPEPSVSATQQYNQQWSRSASQSISSPYRRHQVLPAAPKTGQVSPQSLSFSSQQSYTSSATPYSSSSAAQANNSAAVDRADSRATIVQGSSASLRSIPSRQPSIVTPPPVITRSSSVDSPTDQSAWTSSFASFDTRKASLTPHSSYTAFPGVTRANTGDSFDDSDVKDASDTNACLLSDIAVFVKSHVPRATRSKGPLEHPCSFTGSDVVTTIGRALNHIQFYGRRDAVEIARTLHRCMWFHEVDWADITLNDTESQVFVFSSDEGPDGADSQNFGDLPTGVLTSATTCYSPFCGELTEAGYTAICYSVTCPNRSKARLERQGSTVSQLASEIVEEAENWTTSVPSSVLDSLSKDEIHYQNLVHELIKGEVLYLQDLDLIETAFVQPLRQSNPPIIPLHQLDRFLYDVLFNLEEIRAASRRFVEALLAKQREAYVVHGFGQIMLSAVVEWAASYTMFTVHFPLADWALKHEQAQNGRLADLLLSFSKRPEAARRGFDSFHNRVTPRGLRYNLLLGQMLNTLPEDDPDRDFLQEAMAVLKQQALVADRDIEATRSQVALRDIHHGLQLKAGENLDLDLLDSSRQLFKAGKVLRRPDGATFTEWSEAHLILFDHYLLTTKTPRQRDGRTRYPVTRRAVPLDLVQLRASSFSEPPVARSSGFHLRSARITGTERHPSANSIAPSPSSSGGQETALAYPISFYQLGRFNGPVYYYVESQAERLDWERRLKAAIDRRVMRQEASQVVRLEPLADQVFGAPAAIGALNPDVPANNQYGRPTCSCPLTTADNQSLVIAGCSEGLFIGFRGRPQSVRQVVHLSGITQCAVLPDHGFILVLANRVLIAYSLEALIPSGQKLDPAHKAPQRLSGQKDVSFFRAGRIGDENPRTLVIYAKKSGVKESVFKALEPVTQNDRSKTGPGHRFLGFGKSSPDWFRAHKEFFMPTLVNSVQFHRSKLALVGPKGVEIMDLDSMRTMTVPSIPSSRQDRSFAGLARRCEDAQTLGMFRLQESKFLIVYNDFGFHVGRHGEPVEGPIMEWETTPESVAYCAPYVFLFSSSIIEVRHAFTGRLAQFIIGSQISLTFDGVGLSSSTIDLRSPRVGSPEMDKDRHVHFSMRVGNYHVLYELTPIV